LKHTILFETERLYLRAFRADEAQLLFELDNDPEVMRLISKGQSTPLERIENEFCLGFSLTMRSRRHAASGPLISGQATSSSAGFISDPTRSMRQKWSWAID
jgi:hypothetical protein